MRPAFHMLEIEDSFSGFICCCHTPLPWSAKSVAARENSLVSLWCRWSDTTCTAVFLGRIYARRYVRLSGVKRFDSLSGCFRLVVLPPSPDAPRGQIPRQLPMTPPLCRPCCSSWSDTTGITNHTALVVGPSVAHGEISE